MDDVAGTKNARASCKHAEIPPHGTQCGNDAQVAAVTRTFREPDVRTSSIWKTQQLDTNTPPGVCPRFQFRICPLQIHEIVS